MKAKTTPATTAASPATPMAPAEALLELVKANGVAKLRDYIEQSFWQGKPARPSWQHLHAALKTGDRDVVRLLVTYDARPTVQDLENLKDQAGEDYPQYIRLLRQAGLPMSLAAFEKQAQEMEAGKAARLAAQQAEAARLRAEALAVQAEIEAEKKRAEEKLAGTIGKIPAEWRKLLAGLQAQGAPEAVIAGGALRDLFNNRPIKDVDIFLQTQGSEKKNRKFLAQVFNAAGLRVHEQVTSAGYGSVRREAFPEPSTGEFGSRRDSYGRMTGMLPSESWKILAGPEKTEYNIVFLAPEFARSMHRRAADNSGMAIGLLNAFDFGICQIATDGKTIATTPLYDKDVAQKSITLSAHNRSSKEHLQRIMKKYDGWKLDAGAKKLLEVKPAPRYSSYGGYGRRSYY